MHKVCTKAILLGERSVRIREVKGSNPSRSIKIAPMPYGMGAIFISDQRDSKRAATTATCPLPFYCSTLLSRIRSLSILVQQLKTTIYSNDYGAIYAGIMMTVLPLIVIYLCFSKLIIRGVALGGVKE